MPFFFTDVALSKLYAFLYHKHLLSLAIFAKLFFASVEGRFLDLEDLNHLVSDCPVISCPPSEKRNLSKQTIQISNRKTSLKDTIK